VQIAKLHFKKSVEVKGEKVGILEMRRHLGEYFKGLANFKETRLKLLTSTNVDEINDILDFIADKWHE
jgi:tRNA-dihydrouridine synthase